MKHKIISAALAATVLFGGTAFAAQNVTTPPAPRSPLLHADANKDGVVTKAELLADVDARFAKFDTNKDGKITPEERKATFDAVRGEMRGGGWGRGMRGPEGRGMRGPGGPGMRGDADKDGVITLDERRAQALKIFNYLDRNGDGKVDQAERDQFHDVLKAMGGPGGPGGPGHGGFGRGGFGRGGHGGHRGFGPPPGDMPPPPPPAQAPNP